MGFKSRVHHSVMESTEDVKVIGIVVTGKTENLQKIKDQSYSKAIVLGCNGGEISWMTSNKFKVGASWVKLAFYLHDVFLYAFQ